MRLTTAAIAEYSLSLSVDDFSDEVREQAKRLTLDTLGCTIGGYASQPSKSLRDAYSRDETDDGATIIGSTRTMPTEYAALVNATMGRYLDFNDCYTTGASVCHPSDHIPALVSVAETEGASGAELTEAIVLAYEIHGRGVDTGSIWNRGFDYVTWGAHAAAAAAGKLMGLSERELIDALGIAVTSNNGLLVSRLGEVSNWKAVAQPYATHNAIQACQMARAGLTGPTRAFEGDGGFFETVSGGDVSFDEMGGRGGTFRILETSFKAFACGYFTHPSLTAVLEIVTEHDLDPEEISQIHVRTFDHAVQVYASGPEKWTTELNRETADHSLPYNIAVAVVDREVTPQQYSEDHLTDGRIHDVMQKVSVEADEKLTSHRYEHPRHVPAVVTLTSTDGSQYETRVNYPDGHPERPMSAAEIERKMRSLSTQYLTQDQIDRAVDLCADLTELDSVDDLVATLAI